MRCARACALWLLVVWRVSPCAAATPHPNRPACWRATQNALSSRSPYARRDVACRYTPLHTVARAVAQAGCESFLKEGFTFGDPEDYLHPPGHPHTYRPDYANCPHCTPPVHGECVLLRREAGGIVVTRASETLRPPRMATAARFSAVRT